jgi:hypothetical protein
MAYTVDPTQVQNQNQPGTPGGAAANQPVATSAAPGAGPGGAKTPSGTANQQQSAQPFTNLQAYLSANAPQVNQEANNISSGVTNQYGQVQNDINAGTTGFLGNVAAGFTPENQQVDQAAAANPAQFVQTPGNTAAFQSQINDTYTGPANFEGTTGYAGLNNEVTTDAANAALLNTPAGLQTYLQSAQPNSTQGDALLDTALLDTTPSAIQQISNAATPFSQLPTELSNDVTAADAVASAAPGAAQQAATDANTAITGTEGAFNTTLGNELTNAEGQVNAANTTIGQDQQELNPLEAAYQAYLGQGGYGAGDIVAPLLNQSAIAMPTEAQVATPQDYAENSALEQLMGSAYNPALTDANASQAGTYQAPNVSSLNPQTVAQEMAAGNTASTFNQQDVPNMQNFINFANSGAISKGAFGNSPAELQADIAAGTNPTAQSQLLANSGVANIPNYYSNFNPKALETLLAYLQGVDPSGISKQGSDYIVNS